MLDNRNDSGEPDLNYFVQQHFRRMIATLRQPESVYPSWLADALAFLVEHVESFPPMDSYFDPQLYGEIVEWMRRPDSPQPIWLADVLMFLVEHIESFPPTGNEDAYVVEYIYPH